MDPRTGSFRDPYRQRPQAGDKPPQAGKLKSVTLTVEWGYELHSITIGPRVWQKIQAGKPWGTRGETYDYEGERFGCYWDFNANGNPDSLVVHYGNDGGEGFTGGWSEADVQEEFHPAK
jgi:hypothetical protein